MTFGPRKAIDPSRWRWCIVASYLRSGARNNVLQMHAISAVIRARICLLKDSDCRILRLSDSQVCIPVACKGRSSSKMLNAVLLRLNSLCLAFGLRISCAYIKTDENPADVPSRAHHDTKAQDLCRRAGAAAQSGQRRGNVLES